METSFKDYYQTLGVAPTATADEIKHAFRQLARKYHPDVTKDKTTGEAKFKEINEAYEVLGDPENRKKYDELGQSWQARAAQPGGGFTTSRGTEDFAPEFHFEGTGFSDFFEQIFGRGRNYGGFSTAEGPAPGASAPRHGHDIEGAILVTLEEVMRGAVRSISLQSTDPATGRAKTEEFKVRIPKGALEGQIIRVPGKGEPGTGGGERGHLFLRVRLAANPDFRVLGADLYRDLPLAPWEAVLGATVRARGIDEDLDVKIAPGTPNGQRLRLRGHGLPKPKSEERGDLYFVADIQMPTEVSPAKRKLWEELSQDTTFKPRG